MVGFLTVIFVFVCIFLVVSILLQSSKGGGLAGMFGGGGGMGGVFGGRGAASFLSKITTWLGVSFALISIVIALLSVGGRETESIIQSGGEVKEKEELRYKIPEYKQPGAVEQQETPGETEDQAPEQ